MGLVVVAERELSQLASMRLMGLMMVVVAVVISTGSFIQGFNTVAAPLISMFRTSSSTDSSTSTTHIALEYDKNDASGKSVDKSSKKLKNYQKAQITLKV